MSFTDSTPVSRRFRAAEHEPARLRLDLDPDCVDRLLRSFATAGFDSVVLAAHCRVQCARSGAARVVLEVRDLVCSEAQPKEWRATVDIGPDDTWRSLSERLRVLLGPEVGARALRVNISRESSAGSPEDAGVLAIESGDSGCSVWLEYSPLHHGLVETHRLLGNYAEALQAAAREPDARVALTAVVGAAERELLRRFGEVTRPYPGHCNLAELFQRQAGATPDALACISKSGNLSYAELEEKSNRIARYLRRLGAGPELRVAVCLERNADLVATLLGILKSGAAYVPIDPAYPQARIAYMLRDADARIVVTQSTLRACVEHVESVLVVLDEKEDAVALESGEALDWNTTPRNLAYLVYTSGSTGLPKAAAIEHAGAVDLISWARGEFGTALACVLAAASICFDMSVFELFAPLSTGGTTVIVDNLLKLRELDGSVGLTLISSVPSVLLTVAELGWVPPTTRAALVAGEPLQRASVQRIFAATGLDRIWNAYGLSEDSTYTTCACIGRDSEDAISIGRPITNRWLYVLDDALELTPFGSVGELCVGGSGLAREYVNRPELTAERFLENPHRPGTRMYRSGDLVRYRNDGTLEYIGRKDHQLKVRGRRIEPGEIETQLAAHPMVKECAVGCHEDANGERDLVAYVVPQPGAALIPSELKSHLRRDLPEWMVPAFFLRLQALPRTAHGKLDRNALAKQRSRASAAHS